MKFYTHPRCTTCKKAEAFLKAHDIDYKVIDITEKTPSTAELKKMLSEIGEIRKLFNTSGQRYRELALKDKIPSMTNEEALKLLASDGMLIKRPFLIGDGVAFVGFREPQWEELLKRDQCI